MGHNRSNSAGGEEFVHPDPVMDAALNWFFELQGEPENRDLIIRFEAWRAENPVHGKTFQSVAEAWAMPEAEQVAQNLAKRVPGLTEACPANIVALRRRRRTLLPWFSAAAAALIVMIGIQQYPALRIQWQADYVTVAGEKREVLLPDGSRVILNTDTAIALDFEGTTRSVRLLKGEAYFDVVHDRSRPFDVAAAFSHVQVKGTAFSVRRDDHEDTVALERGHVEVRSLADPGDKVDLEPGQEITATAAAISGVRSIDGSVTFAWLNGQLAFHDRPFKIVLQDLSRYYGHTVISVSPASDDIKVNGRYRLDDPERAIRSLATTVGATVTRLPGGILILR